MRKKLCEEQTGHIPPGEHVYILSQQFGEHKLRFNLEELSVSAGPVCWNSKIVVTLSVITNIISVSIHFCSQIEMVSYHLD